MATLNVQSIVDLVVADLRRQEETSGCAVDHHGTRVQIDGSFDLAPIADLLLREIDTGGSE